MRTPKSTPSRGVTSYNKRDTMDKREGLLIKLKEVFGDTYADEDLIAHVKAWQRRTNISQDMMSDVYKDVHKPDFEKLHVKFIEFMHSRFNEVKRKTGGVELDLYDFVTALGEVGDQMLKLAPGIAPQEAFGEYRFWHSGQKIYSIHNNLCERFLATHIKSVPIELLRLPFPAFRLVIPNNTLEYTTFENKNIFIRELTIIDYFEKRLDRRKIMVLYRAYDDIGYFSISITEDEVHKCCEKTIQRMYEVDEAIAEFENVQDRLTEERREQMRNIFEFILKSILYITGANADVRWVDETPHLEAQLRRATSPGKMKKLQRRVNGARKMFLVGHMIVLSREERMMYENIKQGLWKLSYRFIVQGHWRNQAYGPDRKSRRHIFIEPYWKGPEIGTEINNPHLVK